MSEEWKVGDRVGLTAAWSRPIGPLTVTKVSARKIEISDGSAWTNSRWPRRWGKYGKYASKSHNLTRWDESLVAEQDRYERRTAGREIAERVAAERNDLTWDQINAIRAALAMTKDESE